MINKALEKIVIFFVSWYAKRNGITGAYHLSFDDKDFVYAWVAHSRAESIYKALYEAVKESRLKESENNG